jgi:hypothetical protein
MQSDLDLVERARQQSEGDAVDPLTLFSELDGIANVIEDIGGDIARATCEGWTQIGFNSWVDSETLCSIHHSGGFSEFTHFTSICKFASYVSDMAKN